MDQAPTIEAEITLLETHEGGRKQAIRPGEVWYRPHIVIGNPSQRHPVVGTDGVIREAYLGVQFAREPAVISPGETAQMTMTLIYHPVVNYEAVVPTATFTIREGGSIVGYGTVTKRS